MARELLFVWIELRGHIVKDSSFRVAAIAIGIVHAELLTTTKEIGQREVRTLGSSAMVQCRTR